MKRLLKYITCIILVLTIFSINSYAQRREGGVENLPKFDQRPYHFGFLLGMNKMDFVLKTVSDLSVFDSLQSITTTPEYGFDIGIVSSLKLTKYLSLRFVPTLTFGSRSVEYTFWYKDSVNLLQVKKVESTFMSFPLLLKYQSKRLGNFRAYIIGGATYSIDLASQEKKKDKAGEAPIKLYRNDYSANVGTGFDFFMPYFKLGIELRMSYGLRNLLVPEDNVYTNSIKSLKSKIFQLSITFEG